MPLPNRAFALITVLTTSNPGDTPLVVDFRYAVLSPDNQLVANSDSVYQFGYDTTEHDIRDGIQDAIRVQTNDDSIKLVLVTSG